MMKKIKFTAVLFAICCVSFLAFLAFNPSHAYFQIFTDPVGINTAKVDLLFDKFTEGVTNGDDFTVNLTADWGTPTNPYVMTGKNHVNNLFILQKSGYFAQKVDSDGNPRQSYFRVANKDGTPLVIDCGGMNINPIGSPDNPFTGNIQGAPKTEIPALPDGATEEQKAEYDAKYKYKGNSVSVSAIANLNVIANEDTPDIGFFGRLGYNGTVETVTNTSTDAQGNTITAETLQLTGYAASLDNLLFADVTITTTQSPGTDLATWWNKFIKKDEDGNTVTDADGNVVRNDYYHADCKETHHLGIIAGHAEWASITNISVYYSENVPAFDVGADTTNYYSIVGLLGTLSYVNPPEGAAAGTVIAAGAVSDEQLNEELLSGGGGEGSGMLTGYMLAENIFDRKDADNAKTTLEHYAEAYDVRTVTEDGNPIFTVRTMQERYVAIDDWEYRNYYYFADTVFTFAMTTSVAADSQGNATGSLQEGKIDYIVKIWDLDDENQPPMISLAKNQSDWSHQETGNTEKYQYLQKAEAVTSLTAGDSYILAYQAVDSNGKTFFYTLDMMNSDGFVKVLYPYEEPATDQTTGQVTSFLIKDISPDYSTYSFKYNADQDEAHDDTFNTSPYKTFVSYDNTSALAIYSPKTGTSGRYTGPLSLSLTGKDEKPDLYADNGDSALLWFEWEIKFDSTTTTSNDVIVSDLFRHRNGYWSARYSQYYAKLAISELNTTSPMFTILQNRADYTAGGWGQEESDPPAEPTAGANQEDNLLIFKITNFKEQTLPEMNVLPNKNAETLEFDPSENVLFCEPAVKTGNTALTSAQIQATKNYTVTPLISKYWNNGRGEYLTYLNHAVKMAKPGLQNFQVTMSNTGLGQWFGTAMDTNTGGVVLAPMGTTGVNFTMPVGTIAFYINKASEDDPSEINIIVAASPGDGSTVISLFGPQALGSSSSSFDLKNPEQAFALPITEVVANAPEEGDYSHLTHLNGYYKEGKDDKNNTVYTLETNGGNGYYTCLGGNIVFVGCTFEVTEPGVYLLAPTEGLMSVAYFSVTGAAGAGGDGTGGSPLGDIDFVYDNGANTILTVDQKFDGTHVVESEDLTKYYYPSYHYIRMIPAIADTSKGTAAVTFPSEKLYIRRYTSNEVSNNRKRYLKLTHSDSDTKLLGLSAIYQDNAEDVLSSN